MTAHHCLAVCAPGIEEFCALELGQLGVAVRRRLRGGVEFSATDRQLYATNLWSRTATRVVVRAITFQSTTFAQLEREAANVAWNRWVPDGTTPVIRVSATASALYHTSAVAERLARVTGTGPGAGPLLVARLLHDRVTLSIDSSGEPLHRRGWRLQAAKAPLRETLAAALVMASGWDGRSPLMDPMCGSGTIAIEAACMAIGIAPGARRRFAFQDWPSFQPGTWASVIGEAERRARPAGATVPTVIAADRDAGAVRAARANAERAGVAPWIEATRATVSEIDAGGSETGWLVTNPPYGARLSRNADLRGLYARFGQVVRSRLPGWTVALLVADRRLAAHTGLPFTTRLATRNGGIPVELLVADRA